MVYLYLLSQAEEWNPSHGQIASATGISKRSVVRAIQRLEELGLLEIQKGYNGAKTTYVLR
jgi:Mn-dependent DtxR family transcriptional regulator